MRLGARLGLLAGVALFVTVLGRRVLTKYERFDVYGYDVGIFDQLVWQLSRFQEPFSTIRGIPTFGDHSSYILVLVAPLYWLWADPRVLLALQLVATGAAAVPVYLVAARRLRSELAALALATAYLAYPTLQWASTFEFHPETLAVPFLALAYLAADQERPRLMALWLGIALLGKEDISLVVAGFGVLLALTGRRRWGLWVTAAGLAYFALVTFVLIPWANGGSTSYIATRYGVDAEGLGLLTEGVPIVLGNLVRNATSEAGRIYLTLVFLPLAGLPLLAWRWLVPALPPLVLNLASLQPLQYDIRFHYLAVASVVLVMAAGAGAERLAGWNRSLLPPAMTVLVVCALLLSAVGGPARQPLPPDSPTHAIRAEALALVPDGAAVSVSRNLVPRVSARSEVHQFPSPWEAYGLFQAPTAAQREDMDMVVVDRSQLSFGAQVPSDRQEAVLNELLADPEWEVVLDQDGIVVLERRHANQ